MTNTKKARPTAGAGSEDQVGTGSFLRLIVPLSCINEPNTGTRISDDPRAVVVRCMVVLRRRLHIKVVVSAECAARLVWVCGGADTVFVKPGLLDARLVVGGAA